MCWQTGSCTPFRSCTGSTPSCVRRSAAPEVGGGAPTAITSSESAPATAAPASDPRAADEAKILEFRLKASQAELNVMRARLERTKQAYKAGAASAAEVEEAEAQIAK